MDELGLGEGAEVEITLRDGRLVVAAQAGNTRSRNWWTASPPENRHQETDWGRPRGREVW